MIAAAPRYAKSSSPNASRRSSGDLRYPIAMEKSGQGARDVKDVDLSRQEPSGRRPEKERR